MKTGRSPSEMEKEKINMGYEFDNKDELEVTIKSEKEEPFEMQKEKIEVENEVAQISDGFVEDEYGRCIDKGAAMTNFPKTAMKFERTSKVVLGMQDEQMELQKNTYNDKFQVTDICDPLTIKNVKDEFWLDNENTENVSTSIANDHTSIYPWIKCEAVEELKLENNWDSDNSGLAGITEEYIIQNEDDDASVSSEIHGLIQTSSKDTIAYPVAEDNCKLFVCVHCNMSFRMKITLHDHIIRQHPEHIASISRKIHECAHCTYKTIFRDRFTRHMLQHPGIDIGYKLSVCTHCNRTFMNKPNLDDHIIKKHPECLSSVLRKVHECTECTYKTTIKRELDNHTIKKHPEYIASVSSKIHECIYCIFKSIKIRELDNHIINKHPEFIASVSRKVYECTHCPHKTTIKRDFTRHISKHPGADSSYKLSECIHCNRTFKCRKSLDDHLINKHPEYMASVLRKILECTRCTYKTTIKRQLDNHIIKKHPEYIASVSSKIHECKYCVFKTTLKAHLAQHTRKHPEAEGRYELKTCIHCNATFKSRKNLDNHTVKKHPKYIATVSSKIHVCTHCTYKTVSKWELNIHTIRKHPDYVVNS